RNLREKLSKTGSGCKNPKKSTTTTKPARSAGTRKPPALTEQLCAQRRSQLRVAQLTEENHQHSTIPARGAA
ncbi:hypothetical protein A2U01_0078213, partial [Trifolium medium]|nr:hypothetical protein [Trifolium medium]